MKVHIRILTALLGCAVLMASGEASAKCEFMKLERGAGDSSQTFENPALPWVVSAPSLAGRLDVRRRKNSKACNIDTNSDSAPQIYANERILGVRIIEITSDDVSFYAADTCLPLKKPAPLHLGTRPQRDKMQKLLRAGLCDAR